MPATHCYRLFGLFSVFQVGCHIPLRHASALFLRRSWNFVMRSLLQEQTNVASRLFPIISMRLWQTGHRIRRTGKPFHGRTLCPGRRAVLRSFHSPQAAVFRSSGTSCSSGCRGGTFPLRLDLIDQFHRVAADLLHKHIAPLLPFAMSFNCISQLAVSSGFLRSPAPVW